jgi:hypothetical protein
MAANALAQTPASSPTPAAKPSPNDELLARATKLYYSTAKAGLNSFSCQVHPDWGTLFVSGNKGAPVDPADPRILLLKSVKITLNGKLKGGSTLDWKPAANPDKPLDADSTSMLESMHSATEQTLQGFMQFWTPFMDGSVIPGDAEGLDLTKTAAGHKIHADTNGTSLTEVLDDSLILKEFDVTTNGMVVNFSPSYKPTAQGLLVNAFHAHIQPPGVQPDQAQEMNVAIDYQTIKGFPIPSILKMDVVNTGTFNFQLDGCTVNE